MKLLREIFLALLVTFFGTFFVFCALGFVFEVFNAVFAGGEVFGVFYMLFSVIVSFIPAFLSYKLFRKYRIDK